jgi:hypothetical protein
LTRRVLVIGIAGAVVFRRDGDAARFLAALS